MDAARAAAFLLARGVARPRVGVVLGSGLSGWADGLEAAVRVGYGEIPDFPPAGVAGHRGEVACGVRAGVAVAALCGRLHAYEAGADAAGLARVGFGVRVLRALGAEAVIVTNAAGAIAPRLRPGMLAVIRDHINLIGNPLVGGAHFVAMSDAYSPRLRALAHDRARRLGMTLEEGVYVAVTGPSYETPAEIRALAALGGELVGMSTAPEVIAARHCGLEVLGVSVITNLAAGVGTTAPNHDEVLAMGAAAAADLARLLDGVLAAWK